LIDVFPDDFTDTGPAAHGVHATKAKPRTKSAPSAPTARVRKTGKKTHADHK
jgi:hypothetical protein